MVKRPSSTVVITLMTVSYTHLKDISVIQKKQLIQTIKEYHLQSKDVYSKEDIERIYYHFTKKIF